MFVVIDHDLTGQTSVIANGQRGPAVKKSTTADKGIVTNGNSGGIKKIGTHINI
jgi:hypothetical protein